MMNDITKEQQDKYIIEALAIAGFEENTDFPGIFRKEHGKDAIAVDLTAGQSVYFIIDKQKEVKDGDKGTLALISSIIIDAMDGKMPSQTKADMQYSKDAPKPQTEVPTDTKDVPIVPEPAQACAPTEIIPPQMTPYSMNQIQTIKNTVAKGINDSELEMFLHISQAYGLDPFLKEIFYSSQLKTIMTSRDGYLKVAQRDPTFDGIQSMAVCENDEFEIDAVTPIVIHKFGKGERGKVIGGWAIVHKKGRRPVISYADIREYKKNNNVWNTYESAMICKVAEAFSLKRQFGISGLLTQEEVE